MEFGPRLGHRAGITRILRTLMAVHIKRYIPGVLVAEGAASTQRHVGFDERGGIGHAAHSGAPIEGVRPPQRRERGTTVVCSLTLAVVAMTERASLRVNSGEAQDNS
jgi:hypothetical protein